MFPVLFIFMKLKRARLSSDTGLTDCKDSKKRTDGAACHVKNVGTGRAVNAGWQFVIGRSAAS